MTYTFKLSKRIALSRMTVPALLFAAGACSNADQFGPSSEEPVGTEAPSSETAPSYSGGSARQGIPFAVFDDMSLVGPTFTGAILASGPEDVHRTLEAARKAGARVVIRFSSGDRWLTNGDGSFSLVKWKQRVARFQRANIAPYIADGTLMAHYLIDEPYNAPRWGGVEVPQSTVEEMAAYSKQLWPGLPTVARVTPSWLAKAPFQYKHLDAAWAQYASYKGEPTRWLNNEMAAAESKGLRVIVGLNVLDGGTSASGIAGTERGKYGMSASEVRKFGAVIMATPDACGFAMWKYSSSYYARSDIKAAMVELSAQAKAKASISCRAGSAPSAPPPAPPPPPPPPATPPPAPKQVAGVPVSLYDLPESALASYGGSVRMVTPSTVRSVLATARQHGARIVLRLTPSDSRLRNRNGTFSLTQWKAFVDQYRGVDLNSYVKDGTIAGHMLMESPQAAGHWGGAAVNQATLEAMAQYSRQLWPGMPTIAHASPVWLAQASFRWQYLDAASVTYYAYKGDAGTWTNAQVTAASRAGLGLLMGINPLDGGNSSSGIAGSTRGRYAMSASQFATWGSALLAPTRVCGLAVWRYDQRYFGRADVKSAVATLVGKAKAHAATSCRVR